MLTAAPMNAMTEAELLEIFGGVVEDSPWIASMVWQSRPFPDRERLCAAFEDAIRRLSEDRQLTIIRAHPDLVGKAAQAGTLSPQSAGEQASAGLDRLEPPEIAEFERLNGAYWQRFGFPFVICVRENRKQAILDGLAQRLEHTRQQEIDAAIGEI